MSARLRLVVALAGLVFFVAHVRALPRTIEDLDSINFALGVEQFDVARHRPHPPGYPVFIALAPRMDRDRTAATGLAVWGLVAGTLAPWVLAEFWMAVGLTSTLAVLAAVLTVSCPLFWLTAARPLTDMPGLVAALATQTLFIRGLRVMRAGPLTPMPRAWLWGAFGAGFIIGLRSQTMWLTGPLLFWCAGELAAYRRPREATMLIGAAAIGALTWALPLVWLSGGLGRYLAMLGSQGTADFRDIELLATTPTWRLFRTALSRTFVGPWAVPVLANTMLVMFIVGVLRLAVRGRRVLAALLLACWPYLVFHVTFQETLTLRYALPVVVPVAGLAVVALSIFRARVATAAVAVLVTANLLIAQPSLQAYSRDGDPFFRGFQDMQHALAAAPEPPVLRMQHQVWWAVQRVIEWYHPYWDVGPQPHPGEREWLGVVQYWMSGATAPVWFLTDVSRTDVALFDHRTRIFKGRYEPAPDVRKLMLGSRLDHYDWWEIERPAWMLGTGWALTPEIAGMTTADAAAPHQRAADAFLLRQSRPLRVMVGGRYLAGPGHAAAVVSVAIDGRPIAQWRVGSDPIWFVQWIELPNGTGAGTGPYARLTIQAASEDPARPAPMIGLEQFDAAPTDDPVFAFVDGWQEPEGDPLTGRLWRWTSNRSTIDIRGGTGDLTLQLSGESPLKSFDRAPEVVVRAGSRELDRFRPAADFSREIVLPAAALAESSGRVTIETSLTFVPADRGPTGDRRTLGLRVARVDVRKK